MDVNKKDFYSIFIIGLGRMTVNQSVKQSINKTFIQQ